MPSVLAQPASDVEAGADTLKSRHRGLIVGGGYLVAVSHGEFGEVAESLHGGGGLFVGIQGERIALGIDVAGFTLSRRREQVRLESGPSVELETTTDFARVALFGRYGPRFGSFYPHVEVLAGVHVLTTETTLAGAAPDAEGDREKLSFAPAIGGGVGVMLEAERVPLGFFLRGHVTLGGTAPYLLFDEEVGRFVERSSSTTTLTLSFGVLFYPFF